MAVSHPFSGLELILIVGVFAATEFLFNRSTAPPIWFIAMLAALLVAHLGYYLVVLSILSPEHRLIEKQWSLDWVLSGANIIAAYGPVMGLAMARLIWRQQWRTELALPEVQFLLVWFIVAFALANHNLLIAPRQPLHFTRGYVWTPLALLALPVVEHGIRSALRYPVRSLRLPAVAAILGIALLDNAAWFGREYFLMAAQGERQAFILSDDTKATLNRLSQSDMQGRLLISNDDELGYMTTVYTRLRSWRSHVAITPNSFLRQSELTAFFASGVEVDIWRTRPLVVAVDTTTSLGLAERLMASGFLSKEPVGRYELFVRDPN